MESATLFVTFVALISQFAQLSSCASENFSCSNDLPRCNVSEDDRNWCCPYTKGECCNNTNSCCPEGATCMSDAGLCIPRTKLGLLNLNKLYSPVPLQVQHSKLAICPSKKLLCPGKSTCCPAPYIGHDCCPLVQGICCGDFKHCCPFGTTCDLKDGKCVDTHNNKFPWMKKMKAKAADFSHLKKIKLIKSLIQTCPDGATKCEHQRTCCSSSNGTYECCKYSNGVCCPGAYCCPPGTVCNALTNGCLANNFHVNTFRKAAKVRLDKTPKSSVNYYLKALIKSSVQIVCPGGKYTCPDFTTCCSMGGDVYGCCPYTNGTCCSDLRHCCPSGYECDVGNVQCKKGGMFIPLFEHLPATKVAVDQDCPDKSTCPGDFTCCQLPSLKYGCCPMTSAVCCSDKIHCCPHATTCDLESGTCKQGNHVSFVPLYSINATSILMNEIKTQFDFHN